MTTSIPIDTVSVAGSYENINPANILITNLGNQRQPRLCVFDKTYPICLEIPGKTPFGIDLVYGKQYLKLTVPDRKLAGLLRDIDIRLMQLVPGLKSSVYGYNNIQTVLDRDVEIVDSDNNAVSSYAICKDTEMVVLAELGNIYGKTEKGENYYKWLVKKIILCSR